MLKKIYGAADLAAAPVAKSLDITPRATNRPPAVIYGWNLSPFVFQIQEEGGNPLTIALPFCPFKHRLNVTTEKIIIAVDSAAMVPASPLAAADLRFWIEVSEHDQDLIPGPW